MQEIKINTAKSLTVPAGATSVSVVHEWGDVVATESGLVGGGSYSFTPDSIGAHSITWRNGSTVVSTEHYMVYMPLITPAQFFEFHPELEAEDDKFPMYERRVRGVIEAFTGQKFGPYINKTLRLQGDDGESLALPIRCLNIIAFTDTYEADFTDYVEIAPGTGFFIQRKHGYRYYYDIKTDIGIARTQDFFTHSLDFQITGDFGWRYVPTDVTEAASILMHDEFTQANDLRKHGINEAQLGDFSYKLNADQWGTTGNTQADLILSPYVQMNVGWV